MCNGWQYYCAATGCSYSITNNRTVKNNCSLTAGQCGYVANRTLTVSKSGSGTVTGTGINCGTDCSETYPSGTSVTLTAAPASGWQFASWSGACSGTGTCTLTMNANKSATAAFNVSNHPPSQPTIPSDYRPTGVSWFGSCEYAEAIPAFHWTYFDQDGDPQSAYQIRIDNDSVFQVDGQGNPILDLDEFRCSGTVCTGGASTSFSPIASHWISWAGFSSTYYWKVRVKDSHDSWSEWSNTVSFATLAHSCPDPDFIHSPESPVEGEEVSFTDNSICYNSSNEQYLCKVNTNNRYLWNFGDGTTCDSNQDSGCRGNVSHQYSETRNYTVFLQVTDDVGTCQSQGDTPIITAVPLPEYQEVPPVIFLKNLLASILEFFKNMLSS